MELSGDRQIAAPRHLVFEALNDPEVLRQSIPGCKSLEKTSDTDFDAVVALKVGPVQATFSGEVTLENLQPPASFSLAGKGKGGPAGFASGKADVNLVENGADTKLSYVVNVDMGGKIAQLGSRLIKGTADRLSGQFFDAFSAQVEAQVEARVVEAAQDKPTPGPAESPSAHQDREGDTPPWFWWAIGGLASVIAVAFAAY